MRQAPMPATIAASPVADPNISDLIARARIIAELARERAHRPKPSAASPTT